MPAGKESFHIASLLQSAPPRLAFLSVSLSAPLRASPSSLLPCRSTRVERGR